MTGQLMTKNPHTIDLFVDYGVLCKTLSSDEYFDSP